MIAIIKYNGGNTRSVQNALTRIDANSIVTDDPELIAKASKVILPGVGQANTAMHYLRDNKLDTCIRSLTQPFLGICLGMQLMCAYSEEGNTPCLEIFDAAVKRFPPVEKVPHMGWNNFSTLQGDLFKKIEINADLYYVHSYYAELSKYTIASCDYILPFSAAMQKNNFYGTQFHPEKSADIGTQIIKNFLHL